MAAAVNLSDVARQPDPTGGRAASWDEAGLEALPGWVIFRPVDDGPTVTPGGLRVVEEKNPRPVIVEVLSAGPPGLDKKGRPDGYFVPGLKKGMRVVVPEYGVKIHEDRERGDLRCYEYRQLLALITAD